MFEWLQRKVLLFLLSRQTPEKLLSSAEKRLPRVLMSAAQRSSAYLQILREAGVHSAALAAGATNAPVLEKASTFERFPITELMARDVPAEKLASVLTSSGYGASVFGFGVSDRKQQSRTPGDIDLGLQNAFDVDNRKTLLINTLPMGVVFESRTVCVSNVSVREDMALAILTQAGPLFEQVVLVVDPLFCKRLLDYADTMNYDLSRQRIHMIIGEETFQESFRDYLWKSLGVGSSARVNSSFQGSSMGVGELGLNLFFETPETVAVRRALQDLSPWERQPMFFCFNPLRSWVEVHEPDANGIGDLLITMMDVKTTMPLPRYKTGDRANWVDDEHLEGLPDDVRAALKTLPFPVIALHGRDRDQLVPGWHVDDFKALQYHDASVAKQLSGAFRVTEDEGALIWHLQASASATQPPVEIESALREVFARRCEACQCELSILSELKVFDHAAFPYGMGLDYERKFRYAGSKK